MCSIMCTMWLTVFVMKPRIQCDSVELKGWSEAAIKVAFVLQKYRGIGP